MNAQLYVSSYLGRKCTVPPSAFEPGTCGADSLSLCLSLYRERERDKERDRVRQRQTERDREIDIHTDRGGCVNI